MRSLLVLLALCSVVSAQAVPPPFPSFPISLSNATGTVTFEGTLTDYAIVYNPVISGTLTINGVAHEIENQPATVGYGGSGYYWRWPIGVTYVFRIIYPYHGPLWGSCGIPGYPNTNVTLL